MGTVDVCITISNYTADRVYASCKAAWAPDRERAKRERGKKRDRSGSIVSSAGLGIGIS